MIVADDDPQSLTDYIVVVLHRVESDQYVAMLKVDGLTPTGAYKDLSCATRRS